MKIDAYFSAAEVDPAALAEATVVVVDVLRATTTVVEALANGARGIYPTASTEEAVKLASRSGARTRCCAASGRARRSRASIWATHRASSRAKRSRASGWS
jgi:DNA-binding NarL/FixJ family response regulator